MAISWRGLQAALLRDMEQRVFRIRFEAMRDAEPDLRRFRDPAALLDHQQVGDADAEARNAVLAALVRLAGRPGPRGEAALVLLILALWPGLDALRCRLRNRFRGEGERIDGDLPAMLALGIRRLDLARVRRIAATLLRNVERDLVRLVTREQADRRLFADRADAALDLPDPRAECGPDRDAILRGDLGRVLGRDAGLVADIALDGLDQREAAARAGVSHEAGRKRYQRALARLRAEFLH